MTNYEKIKSMSVDEMAEFFCNNFDCSVCPAFDTQYWCFTGNFDVGSNPMKKYLESKTEYCTDKKNKLVHCEDCHEEC